MTYKKVKKTIETPTHRLFILVKMREQKLPNGSTNVIGRWIETTEADFGSRVIPNREILQYKLEPIRIEPDDAKRKKRFPFEDIMDRLREEYDD